MGGSKSATVGYFYYKDLQGVLCHSPVNAVTKIECSDREIFRDNLNGSQVLEIKKGNVFGGKDREGGISGKMEFLFGDEDQEPSAYMVSQIGEYVPASRGVLSVIFQNLYVGMNPYFRDFKYRVKTISTGWYDEKAEIKSFVYNKPKVGYKFNINHEFYYENSRFPNGITEYNKSVPCRYNGESSEFYSFHSNAGAGAVGFALSRHSFIFDKDLVLKARFTTRTNPAYKADMQTNGEVLSKNSSVIDGVLVSVFELALISQAYVSFYTGEGNSVTSEIDVSFHDVDFSAISVYDSDLNPAHIIRLCFTDKIWGLGINSSKIDDVAFRKCADRLYSEKLGISIVWAQTTSVWQFMREICDHVQAVMPHEDVNTGLWTWALLRDDYNVNSLLHLDESTIEQVKEYKRKTMSDMVNVVTVSYTDREQGKVSAVTVDNPARVAQQGRAIETKAEYLGFTNSEIAARIALRDLKTLSKELATITFTALSAVKNLKIGDCFTWSWNDFGISRAVMRVQSVKRAGILSSKYIITAVEDSFSTPMEAVMPYVPPTQGNFQDAQPLRSVVIEAPYYELVQQLGQTTIDSELSQNPDIGYLIAAASTDQNALNAILLTSSGGDFEEKGIIDLCEFTKLVEPINKIQTVLVTQGINREIPQNSYFKINDELMEFVQYNPESRQIVVNRGVNDTVPQNHVAESEIWFLDENRGYDETAYFDGQTVQAKALTNTGSDVLSESLAAPMSLELNARAIRPYPPANLKLNGYYFPESLLIINNLDLLWSTRNRITQTAGTLVNWYDSDIISESGVTYSLELSVVPNGVIHSASGITTTSHTILKEVLIPNKSHTLKIWSVRDGLDSFQKVEHSFFVESASLILTATTDGKKVVGNTVATANINVNVDTSLSANMQYDGTGIKGKTLPNSIITIEVEN